MRREGRWEVGCFIRGSSSRKSDLDAHDAKRAIADGGGATTPGESKNLIYCEA